MTLIKEIKHSGQEYVDEPVHIYPRPESHLSRCIRQSLGDKSEKQPITVGYERIKLQWMKPDGQGGLTPRGGR